MGRSDMLLPGPADTGVLTTAMRAADIAAPAEELPQD
jgi:hypothetical protein